MKDTQTQPNFEQAFARLEEILAKMNSGELSLDESLKLYEEADRLIIICGKRLAAAENRVDKLIKTREGRLLTSAEEVPQKEPFSPSDQPCK